MTERGLKFVFSDPSAVELIVCNDGLQFIIETYSVDMDPFGFRKLEGTTLDAK